VVDRPFRRAMLNKCGFAANLDIEVGAATTARSTFLKPALFQAGDGFAQHAVAKVALSHVEQF
jgi:hypothetical protein